MATAIDTSFLIEFERKGIPASVRDGAFYIPALAATEFLIGAHWKKVPLELRERARRVYEDEFRHMIVNFDRVQCEKLALLLVELREKGQTMGFFDSSIAATSMAYGDSILVSDSDFDRLSDRLTLLKEPPGNPPPGKPV